MQIFKKYTFFSLLIFFISLVSIASGIYLNNKYSTILQKNKLAVNELSKEKYNIIKSYLFNTKKDLQFIGKIKKEFKEKHRLEEVLKTFSNENVIYSQIRFLDPFGKETLRINNKKEAKIVSFENLQDKADRYYFKNSKTLKKDQIYLSPFDLNVEKGKIERPFNPTLRFSTPVYNQNKRTSYVVLNYKGKELLEILKKNSMGFSTILLNKDANYILSSENKSHEWNFMFKDKKGFLEHNKKVWQKIKTSKTNKGLFKSGSTYYSFLKIDPSSLLNSNFKTNTQRQWYLINYFEKSKVYEEFINESKQLLWIFIVIILLLVFVSFKLADYLKKLEKANERIKIASNAFENSQEGIFVLNKQGKIININKGFTSITGFTLDDVYLKTLKVLKDKEKKLSKKFFKDILKTVYKNDFWSGELNNRGKNKEAFVSHLTVSTIKEEGKIKYYVGVFSDISEIIKQKKKIEKTNEELVNTLENLKATQEQLVEAEKLSALGQLVSGIAHEINSPLGAIKTSSTNVYDSLKKTLVNKPKLELLLNTKEKLLLKELYEDIENSSNNLTIKEQRELKKELRVLLDSLEIKESRFLANTLYFFNLKDIKKYKDLLKHKEARFIFSTINDEFVTLNNLENIQTSVNKAAKTIFALKKFSHFDHDREGTFEKLETELENILVILHHTLKQNIELIKNYEPLEKVFCYPDELGQVWMNLISNAIHAMSNKGKLTLSIYEEEQYQVVSIADTGGGIPKEIQEKIFKPFFTTKEAGVGSGLGLGIVQKVVSAHKGKVEFKSSKEGTTFYVKIPKGSKIYE